MKDSIATVCLRSSFMQKRDPPKLETKGAVQQQKRDIKRRIMRTVPVPSFNFEINVVQFR